MEDFNALAAALGDDLEGVRACLILSRDGLLIGAHPADGEDEAKPAWLRVATLGEPERGFFQFATETWCYVRRGPYAAFVIATATVRPGLLIDQMERVLLAAEEVRADRSSIKPEAAAPPPAVAPSGKPRTALHREPAKADEPIVLESEPVGAESPVGSEASTTAEATAVAAAEAPGQPSAPGPDGDSRLARQSMWATEGGDEDVDTFSLTRELGRLLQGGEDGADG
jgi:hypothetical protein